MQHLGQSIALERRFDATDALASAQALYHEGKFDEALVAVDGILSELYLAPAHRRDGMELLAVITERIEIQRRTAPVVAAAREETARASRETLLPRKKEEASSEYATVFGALVFLLRRNKIPLEDETLLHAWCGTLSPDRALHWEDDELAFLDALRDIPERHRESVGWYLTLILWGRGLLDDDGKEAWRRLLSLPMATHGASPSKGDPGDIFDGSCAPVE
jgi:hypothetical protein